jgi:uncharacterized cupin superfamily protein
MINRPPFIKHFSEIQQADDSHYPGSSELLSIGSPFGKLLGLQRIGIHHETLLPGRRTSWPHAERDEEEFVYVIEGTPDIWIDGNLHRLGPGDAVGFPAGTGIAHTMLNNSPEVVRLLVVGERSQKENQIYYPLHPDRNREVQEKGALWKDWPARKLGPHDGLPKVRDEKVGR